jgi:hypothetical protein
MPDIGSLWHEEKGQDKLNGEGTRHGVERCLIATVLDDLTGCCMSVSPLFILKKEPLQIGWARLIPPSTPRLNTADLNPR